MNELVNVNVVMIKNGHFKAISGRAFCGLRSGRPCSCRCLCLLSDVVNFPESSLSLNAVCIVDRVSVCREGNF